MIRIISRANSVASSNDVNRLVSGQIPHG
ncbi:ryhB-regulated fur leader peptide [Escherichia coli]|nr:ryhB-regulated fur leader peptide [Escherichia coli]